MTDRNHEHPLENIELDHLDFRGAYTLRDTLAEALTAVASYQGHCDALDNLGFLLARAEVRKAEAFTELEREQRAKREKADD